MSIRPLLVMTAVQSASEADEAESFPEPFALVAVLHISQLGPVNHLLVLLGAVLVENQVLVRVAWHDVLAEGLEEEGSE